MATRRAALRQIALQLSVGLGVAATKGWAAAPAPQATAYVGIASRPDGTSRALYFSASGAGLGQTPLDFHAHGMARHQQTLVVFARRPGTRFAVVSTDTLRVSAVVQAPQNRHFFGHGAFTQDGAHLVVAENDLEQLQGVLAIYDMTGPPRRMGQIPLPGPGPHELIRLPGGNVFAVALGGLQTHPDYGRTPLNLDSFRSQILLYDHDTSRVEALGHWPGSERVSLRHLAQDGRGRLYIGGQAQSGETPDATKPPKVLWMVENGIPTALPHGRFLGGYVSSVTARGGRALISSKSSGAVLELDGPDLLSRHTRDGASAVALGPGLRAESGFALLTVNGTRHTPPEGTEFDNHGLAL